MKSDFEKHQEKQFTEAEQALLAKAKRLIQSLPERAKTRQQVAQTIIPEKQIITVQESKTMGAVTYMKDSDKTLLLKGDVFVQGNIDGNWRDELLKGMQWEGIVYDVMIDGNLIVAGDIIDNNYLMLQVMGNVVCDYFLSENGHQYIKGDLIATQAVYGEYNDGSLKLGGEIDTPFIVSKEHDMPKQSRGEFIHIEYGEIADEYDGEIGWGWTYFENSSSLFDPKVLNDEGEFVEQKFINMLKNGENPFVEEN
ncbi:MAG: hypothetical protein Q4C98_11485 [Capnocytophaga sp.]|nr:hypothetical protein [Capnocytophaga sp.]